MDVPENLKQRVGILAYGSLIDDPGDELKAATAQILIDGVRTPFNVEFARESKTRAHAPTLVRVEKDGSQIPAQINVLKEGFSEKDASDILWRRETDNISTGKNYTCPDKPGRNHVIIYRLVDFRDVGPEISKPMRQSLPYFTQPVVSKTLTTDSLNARVESAKIREPLIRCGIGPARCAPNRPSDLPKSPKNLASIELLAPAGALRHLRASRFNAP